MTKLFSLLLCLFLFFELSSQISFSANDFVPPVYHPFGYGVNMGAFRGWADEDLANIAAGNPDENIVGLGANSVRVWLPEWFTETWGYEIRVDAFRHYSKVGMNENVVFIGDPSPEHMDSTLYCPGRYSESFKNLYRPIWDGGLHGTPVNEENFYAVYIYNLVLKYGEYVKYWEITNEPDTDLGGNALAEPGQPGNWWENDPPACETKFGAPIQHYIRTMRIAYEVVKSLQPDDYITTGGIGNKTFLDAILRNTDNPDEGKVNGTYPKKGGAYFDCLSFHAYPHFDGSMRRWSDAEGGFVWTRNSDKGIEGFFDRMDGMINLMHNYGYDGDRYPEKTLLCTETNLSRNALTANMLGDDESQRNFIIKILTEGQKRKLNQIHIYSLADHLPVSEANSDFDFMGLYENLTDVNPSDRKITDAGIAFKTTSTILKGYRYDPQLTDALNLTNQIRGGAFINDHGDQIFVLWGATKKDNSEEVNVVFDFPKSFGFNEVKRFEWDFSVNAQIECISSREIQLSGSPIFLIPDNSQEFSCESGFKAKAFPNPFREEFSIEIQTDIDEQITLDLFDARGVLITEFLNKRTVFIGKETLPLSNVKLESGIYFLRVKGKSSTRVLKIVKK